MTAIADRVVFGRRRPGSIAATDGDWIGRHGIGLMLLVAAATFAAGVTLPMFKISKFLVLTDRYSVVMGVYDLARDGELLVAAAIAVFALLFPALKIALTFWLWAVAEIGSGRQAKGLRWLDSLGKWSMVDVFVVALIVFSAKATGVATAGTEPGLYAFATSLVLVALSVRFLKRRLDIMKTQV